MIWIYLGSKCYKAGIAFPLLLPERTWFIDVGMGWAIYTSYSSLSDPHHYILII